MKLGLELIPQCSDWELLAQAARRAEAAALDSLWCWDHLASLYGRGDGPALEGWTVLAGLAAITRSASVGLMVGANTLRHPAVVAKTAATVDAISGGRCILGLGAGSNAAEHRANGIPFADRPAERLARLAEAIAAIRGLHAGDTVTSAPDGHYALDGAAHRPLPANGPGSLPLLIGGSGPTMTLPLVARWADLWNPGADLGLERVRRSVERLAELCADHGRDPREIERTFNPIVVIRDSEAAAARAYEGLEARLGAGSYPPPEHVWVGPPARIAERASEYIALGFDHFIAGLLPPYDAETIERLPEVAALLSPIPARSA